MQAPDIDYQGLSPLIALAAGSCVERLAGPFRCGVGLVQFVLGPALWALVGAFGFIVWDW